MAELGLLGRDFKRNLGCLDPALGRCDERDSRALLPAPRGLPPSQLLPSQILVASP